MPPRDSRLRPALEVARPGAATGYRADRSRWLVLFGDGEYHPVTALASWTDSAGRKVVQVEWSIELETYGEVYLFDAGRMAEA